MGVIKPPWISKDWFKQTPFNYCDHFGDRDALATVCKICKEEREYYIRCEVEGKDPHDMANAFEEIGNNLSKAMEMVAKEAKRMQIDLNNLKDDREEPSPAKSYPIYKLVNKYSKRVEQMIKNLSEVPVDADMELISMAVDVFSHSRYYIVVKTGRALSSRWEEKRDPEDDTFDAKTSAFLAYVAIERNSRAALALARHKPLTELKQQHLKFAKASLEVALALKQEFFPKDKLLYSEFGCENYDETFYSMSMPESVRT